MGGMMAAEIAALDNSRAKKLVLVGSAGFWLDEHPIPDLFAAQLDEIRAAYVPRSEEPDGAGSYRDPDRLQGARDDVRRAGEALRDGEQIPCGDSRSRAQEARVSDQVADARPVGRVRSADSRRSTPRSSPSASRARRNNRSRMPATCCPMSSRRRSARPCTRS